uniref:Uncharacterized protein n=1 Tax=Trypanosoma congolense (strain IL3000) TaxID=1068625 RepID=G0UTH5_TRYCI|nr:hypothetical protein, unlikely [Trypanosoma congolense IL3000]
MFERDGREELRGTGCLLTYQKSVKCNTVLGCVGVSPLLCRASPGVTEGRHTAVPLPLTTTKRQPHLLLAAHTRREGRSSMQGKNAGIRKARLQELCCASGA